MADQFTVEPREAGLRLDQFLAARLPHISRARAQELIDSSAVLLNGSAAKPSSRLRVNDSIELRGEPDRPPIKAEPEDIPLTIVYDDPDFAVIDKPAGMTVHAGAGSLERNHGTLVNALLHRFGSLSEGSAPLRPGIVHRLDKETSGLILIAKNDLAHRALAEQFQRREVEKTYIALLHGEFKQPAGTIDLAIVRDPIRRNRMSARRTATTNARHAISHYEMTESLDTDFGKFSLARIRIETGRTHQIRVHMAALHHPVVGDTLYGAPREMRSSRNKRETLSLDRNFLHAAELKLAHPCTGKRLSFHSPLPSELESFLQRLRG